MLMKLVSKYFMTAIGGTAVVATVVVSGIWLGQASVSRLIAMNVLRQGESFAQYLLAEDGSLDALLTGLARDPDIEARVRAVANASGVSNFTIFDTKGEQVFSPRSDRHTWLLRERPGGVTTSDTLAGSYVEREGPWQEIEGLSGDTPSTVMPLDRDGRRIGFISVSSDIQEIRATYSRVLGIAVSLLLIIVIMATGLPALIYMRRKWRIEQADERIQFLANYDTLTNLLNRKRIEEETDRVLATSRATRERLAVWAIDIEGLADINNSIGQAGGDEVIRTVATRLSNVIERSDFVSRTGADDFVILQRRIGGRSEVEALAKRIQQRVETEIVLDGHTIKPRLCMGVATVPEHGRTYADLVRHAELALLVHKSSKAGDFILFETSMDEEANRRRNIERRMKEALETNGFELFYQPIVSSADNAPLGFECLLRLPDGEGGYIPPSVFIPIAEARGYIKAIGDWVIGEATRQIALWPDELFVSVNLSAVQFRDGDLVQIVENALRKSGIDGRRLEIEVVESLLLDRSDRILDQLRGLKALGTSIAMDDFGTGYSSLGYLWRFPFDKLKIDQSFMLAFEQGEANVRQILETIVSLGHHMGLKVVTEGIETHEQASMLSELGCDQLQGYYFGKPMPQDRIATEMLRTTASRARTEDAGAAECQTRRQIAH